MKSDDVQATLEQAARNVCDYDWSDNDDDAVEAIQRLRDVITAIDAAAKAHASLRSELVELLEEVKATQDAAWVKDRRLIERAITKAALALSSQAQEIERLNRRLLSVRALEGAARLALAAKDAEIEETRRYWSDFADKVRQKELAEEKAARLSAEKERDALREAAQAVYDELDGCLEPTVPAIFASQSEALKAVVSSAAKLRAALKTEGR